jgi:DNA-binding transcriptional ArsR family regulator
MDDRTIMLHARTRRRKQFRTCSQPHFRCTKVQVTLLSGLQDLGFDVPADTDRSAVGGAGLSAAHHRSTLFRNYGTTREEGGRVVKRGRGRSGGAAGESRAGDERAASLELLLRLREEAEASGGAGTVAYAGAALLDGGEHLWASEHPVAELMAADWGGAAVLLQAMGSPPRLALLAAFADGPRTRAELQEALGGESTTGQLYHHLRELQLAGLIAQRRRGEYEVVSRAVIPILAILAAALDMSGGIAVEEPE